MIGPQEAGASGCVGEKLPRLYFEWVAPRPRSGGRPRFLYHPQWFLRVRLAIPGRPTVARLPESPSGRSEELSTLPMEVRTHLPEISDSAIDALVSEVKSMLATGWSAR